MTQSMSRVCKCIDNGQWKAFGVSCYYGREFTDQAALIQTIENCTYYYSTRRLQHRLGVLTPMEKHALSLAA